MNGRRSIRRRVRKQADGVDLVADINAELSINAGGSGRTTVARSVHNTAITQSSSEPTDPDKDREKR